VRTIRPALAALVLALALAPAACVLHLGDDDDDGPWPCKTTVAPALELSFVLDPATLVCEEAAFPCDGTCGPCTEPVGGDPQWAPCQSACTGLDAATCAATSGCRQAWDETCLLTDAICTLPDGGFYGCVAVDTRGPTQGSCNGLAAEDCSLHDDCLATYRRDERCANQRDDDGDGTVDEPDECLTVGTCLAE
jgi:hypothetical protein